MEEVIKNITETIQGYKVKNLRWLPLDNIIVGQVLDPIWTNPNLHEGYTTCKWRKNGACVREKERTDLTLKMNYGKKKKTLI